MRNPLRKKELSDRLTNKEYYDSEIGKLSDDDKQKIKNMRKNGVDEDTIQAFQAAKIKKRDKELQNILKGKNKESNFTLIHNNRGLKIYRDKYVSNDFDKNMRNDFYIKSIPRIIMDEYRDIIPNRKPVFVITDTEKNPLTKNVNLIGDDEAPGGVYHGRIVYLDQYSIGKKRVVLHEYAHFLADRVKKQVEPIIKKEYQKMLQNMFGKRTKMKNLEGLDNEENRRLMASKMNLPSDYSSTNFDEWFAEIIAHWKMIPNNKETYRFKQIMKKIITRL